MNTLAQFFGPIFGLVIVFLLIKFSIGYLTSKSQKGIHGDIARHIVKKSRGKSKGFSGFLRRLLLGP